MYRWNRSLDQGLKESGKLVPKSLVGGLQKRVEELEREGTALLEHEASADTIGDKRLW